MNINKQTILQTSKFLLTTAKMKKGDSFTATIAYSSNEMSVQEVNDIIAVFDRSDLQEFINRLKFNEEGLNGFGRVEIKCEKKEIAHFNVFGLEDSKNLEINITVTAVEDISAGSVLRL